MMKPFKQFLTDSLEGKLPDDKLDLLPSGYQKVGDIIILNLPKELEKYSKEIGKVVLDGMKPRTVCARMGPISGEKREPEVKRIAGGGTETVHTENSCKYSLDVAKVMFAKGNVKERGRIAKMVKPGETVLDMFAGIGYFSIPIAKACPKCKVISIDVNPVSISYLTKNIMLNRIFNIEMICGDCRKTKLRNIADRISMGYLPGTDKFLPAAFRALKKKGVIHFHDVYKDEEIWDKPISVLEKAAKKSGYRLKKILSKVVVKQYAPRRMHIVIDAEFVKA